MQQQALGAAAPVPVLSVTELNQRVRASLDRQFGEVWVGGEISNLRVPASGHVYFSLKDHQSQIAAVMFRSAGQALRFRPEDGLDVIVRGRISLYEVRGLLQLYVETMEPRGLGAMQLALEQLKQRLAAEGLFDAARKRDLPAWPRSVGVATALTGAVVHDVLTTLRARMPQVRVVIRPVRVQGRGAGAEIAAALADLNAVPEVDVIIVGRGGGSVEDLWAFNEEAVARAVAASPAPVVSAVGHEIDFTLADLAADRRAATPTAAAAMVVPDRGELTERLRLTRSALQAAWRRSVERVRSRFAGLVRQLRDPRQTLRMQRQRIDETGERGRRAVSTLLRLSRQTLQGHADRLQALSPLGVLQRGYAIAQRAADGHVIRAASELAAEERLKLTFARGSAQVRVEDWKEE